jgi:hypothetical protein
MALAMGSVIPKKSNLKRTSDLLEVLLTVSTILYAAGRRSESSRVESVEEAVVGSVDGFDVKLGKVLYIHRAWIWTPLIRYIHYINT